VLPPRKWLGRQDYEAVANWPTKLCVFKAGTARWPDDPAHNHVEPVVDGRMEVWNGPPIDHLLFRSVHQQLEKHIRYTAGTKPLTYGSVPLTPWVPFRLLWKNTVRSRFWRDGTAGLAEAMLFTMKDWYSVLNEWEWRGHPEIPMSTGAKTIFTAAEVVDDVAQPRKLASMAKQRARRLVDRMRR
jgi:hypothetical protein